MKLSNVWRAYISSFVGVLIPIATGMITDLASGQVDWQKVKLSIVPAVILIVTDLLKEVQKEVAGADPVQTPAQEDQSGKPTIIL